MHMKDYDQEQLESLLSIFSGYQVGVVLAILAAILIATFYFNPGSLIYLIILILVILAPYCFITRSQGDDWEDQEN